MTREAKIGMLTGLGVIVLIGVLLSNYLGNGSAGILASTIRMAPLPAGAAYRDQIMQPMGVAAPAPGPRIMLANGAEVASPIDTNNGLPAVPVAVADMTPAAPVIGPAVSPVPVGPSAVVRDLSGPPTIAVADPRQMIDVKIHGGMPVANPPAAPAIQTVAYEIQPGDNLAKIAKKFYGSAKNSDVARIVKANPDQLKDASSTLMAGKKLTIPNVAAKPAPNAAADVSKPVALKSDPGKGTIVVPLPGDVTPAVPASRTTPTAAKPDTTIKTYQVKPGDSLRQIAATVAGKTGAGITDTMKKIVTLNNLGNPDALRAGTTLKLP